MTSPFPSDDTDAMVARVRAGDERVFEGIFRAHYGSLCAFANTLVRSRETAEEVVQNVFLNIWTQRDHWEVRGSVRAYLFGAVRNQALNQIKRGQLERSWAEDSGDEGVLELHGSIPDPAALVEAEEMAAVVREAIDRLPPRARMAVQLRWEGQLKYSEIAEVMGISVKGVENQLSRALEALRRLLGDRGG
ncbi:MAG TPA: RNA polymerase sigma-70 factor [Gemmatimonadaceae bacterium]|nr:RNA polymerase sigma-70 factor [Gemmatimonadaceae bacterium]